jgi:hypothetical protein
LRANSTVAEHDVSEKELPQISARPEAIHGQTWQLVRAMAQQEPPVKGTDEMLRLLIDVSSVHDKRVQAFQARVPDPIIWLLLGNAVIGTAAIGASGGLKKHRGISTIILYSLVVCATIFVVLEMDRPGRGVLRPDEGPMIRLKQLVNLDREAGK